MNRRNRRGGERYVALHHWMLRSAAWRALSPKAKAVLIHIWERHNGTNNGQIVYAVRDAQEIGVGRSNAAVALSELVQLGFLRVMRDSAFRIKTKEAREWAITAEPLNGQPATKEFMRSAPAKNETRSGRPDRQSAIPDRDPNNGTQEGITVRYTGPSEAKPAYPQSAIPDTSIIPCGALPAGDAEIPQPTALKTRRAPLRFGDVAKAERTARVPRWV